MPEKHPNTERWGGPGAAHEDASKEKPPEVNSKAGKPTNPRTSQVSGGGGERDIRHGHDDAHRSSKTSHS